jgi:hypothetical protein
MSGLFKGTHFLLQVRVQCLISVEQIQLMILLDKLQKPLNSRYTEGQIVMEIKHLLVLQIEQECLKILLMEAFQLM